MRSIGPESSIEIPTEKSDFKIPSLNIKALTRLSQGQEADAGDKKVYWRVNTDRFTQDLR